MRCCDGKYLGQAAALGMSQQRQEKMHGRMALPSMEHSRLVITPTRMWCMSTIILCIGQSFDEGAASAAVRGECVDKEDESKNVSVIISTRDM